jgi:hypothetical protein
MNGLPRNKPSLNLRRLARFPVVYRLIEVTLSQELTEYSTMTLRRAAPNSAAKSMKKQSKSSNQYNTH